MSNYQIAGINLRINQIEQSFLTNSLKPYVTTHQPAYVIDVRQADEILPLSEGLVKESTYRRIFQNDGNTTVQVYHKEGHIRYQISYDKDCINQSILISSKETKIDEAEYILVSMSFLELSLRLGYINLHASVVVKNNEAYLFCAPSGTGKSTHSNYYLEAFRDAFILNDDKPLIKDGMVYGTPFSGKNRYNKNEVYHIRSIYFIKQGPLEVRTLTIDEKLKQLIMNSFRPDKKELLDSYFKNIEYLLTLPIHEAILTNSIESVYLTYYHIIKEKLMQLKPGYVLREVGSKYIVIPVEEASLDFNGIMTLNKTGKLLFECLKDEQTVEDLVNALTASYEVTEELARKDVIGFIEHLKKHQLLK